MDFRETQTILRDEYFALDFDYNLDKFVLF